MAGVISLVMATGQTIDQALSLTITDGGQDSHYAAGCLMRRVPAQRGAWRPTSATESLLRPRAAHVPLALPVAVADWMRARSTESSTGSLGAALGRNVQSIADELRKWLSSHRQSTGGLATLGRVERWLSNALYQVRPDHVPPFLLSALNDAIPCPAAYYRAYRARELTALHFETLRRSGWEMPTESPPADGWVGSELNPSPETMKRIWRETRDRLLSIAQDNAAPLHARHNAREAHEVLLLMFQTLHRAVSDPVESLDLLDLDHGRIVINDKHQGDARAHRIVPLPALAVRQCLEHKEHVERLAHEIHTRASETSKRLHAMLLHPERRTAPFRFFLSPELTIVRIDRSTLESELRATWPLPIHAARHVVSTFLLEQQAPDSTLRSLLGHSDIGTQALSMYSPLAFDTLYRDTRNLLDRLANEFDLQSIPSFLPGPSSRVSQKVTRDIAPMLFGSEARAKIAEARARAEALAIDRRIDSLLEARGAKELCQEDVDTLFSEARDASSNMTHRVARDRDEYIRAAVIRRMRATDTRLDLPAIPVTLSDVALICPPDCLESDRRVVRLNAGLRNYWGSQFNAWKRSTNLGTPTTPAAALLTLMVTSLVIDPEAWPNEERPSDWLETFRDTSGITWIRVRLKRGMSRLYPIDRHLAEVLSSAGQEALGQVKWEDIVRFANGLIGRADRFNSFPNLLRTLRSGLSATVPGIALAYADGSLGSVSASALCIERETGHPPTKATLARHAQQTTEDADPAPHEDHTSLFPSGGALVEVDRFRRLVANALQALRRESLPRRGMRAGPVKQFLSALEDSWVDLAGSPQLPPICALTAGWLREMALHGQRGGKPYAPKTILNYWYSWGLRVIDECAALDLRKLHAEEIEEVYLQMVEVAEVENRQHLYSPMRNLHSYLVKRHGVEEIDWSELQDATGQMQRRTDANVVHLHEYFKALSLLQRDVQVSPRISALQSAALVLTFRFGLRIGECLGLRYSDLYFDNASQGWRVRLRGNRFRRLKTRSSRRLAIQVEAIEPQEDAALRKWREHVTAFGEEHRQKPLFARTGLGEAGRELFPRQTIAMRLGQALRAATGDPTVRVHHCRHAYASRILAAVLSATPTSAATQMRTRLAGADVLSPRLTWAVAAMMGHASPQTTMETYFHSGHSLLMASQFVGKHQPDGVDPAEWFAFCCAVRRKTMLRAFQRASADEPLEVAMRTWSRVGVIGTGPKVSLPDALPPLPFEDSQIGLVAVDRIIDHARRFGKVDGLAARLYISESCVADVLSAAAEFGRTKRKASADESVWWIDDATTQYSAHELRQINHGLSVLEALSQDELSRLADTVERCLIPSSRMLVIEDLTDLEVGISVLRRLVDKPGVIELLTPAVLPKRVKKRSPRTRAKPQHESAGTSKEEAKSPTKREGHKRGIPIGPILALREFAEKAGISVCIHGRVPGARSDSHSRLRSSARFGLRIHENSDDRIRSSKVLTRLLAVTAIAARRARRQ